MGSAPARVLAATGILLAASGGCAATGSAESTADASGSPSSPAPAAAAEQVAPARRAHSVVAPESPASAVLRSGRRVRVNPVGTTGAGVLAVPEDVDVAGWWVGGSRLGDPFGSILVAAHVDSRGQGLGPFAELLTVDPGTRVRLASASLQQVFEVRSRRLVPQDSLVDDSWIFAATGSVRLTLVTCAPPYDASRGGYRNLAVITAVPLGPPEET